MPSRLDATAQSTSQSDDDNNDDQSPSQNPPPYDNAETPHRLFACSAVNISMPERNGQAVRLIDPSVIA